MSKRLTVVGSGVMGTDVALSLAMGGHSVTLWGRRDEGIAEAQERLQKNAKALSDHGLADEHTVNAALDQITTTTDRRAAVSDADFVLEAIAEDLELKQQLLTEVAKEAPAHAVLSSTTSGISPTEIAQDLPSPERFVVAHYAQPAHLVEVVEVVPGAQTSENTVEFVEELLQSTGKLPVRVGDIPGFLWARLQSALLRELLYLVQRGDVTAQTCDLLIKRGYASRLPAMGPFEHADLAGLDLTKTVADGVWPDLSCAQSVDETPIASLLEQEQYGMEAGYGFYDWHERDPDAFREARDTQIINHLKLMQGGSVVLEQQKGVERGEQKA